MACAAGSGCATRPILGPRTVPPSLPRRARRERPPHTGPNPGFERGRLQRVIGLATGDGRNDGTVRAEVVTDRVETVVRGPLAHGGEAHNGLVAFPIIDLNGYFSGEWRLVREIADADGEAIGTATGRAAFALDADVLIYHESGELQLGAHRGPFVRTLHYRSAGGARAAVHFDHGGFFHDVDLATGEWAADHPCSADWYRGAYRLLDARRWEQEWAVTGPAKDHVITTRFTRVGE